MGVSGSMKQFSAFWAYALLQLSIGRRKVPLLLFVVCLFVKKGKMTVLLLMLLGSWAAQHATADVWCAAPYCASLEMTAEFITVDYDWTGSGYANASAAQSAGAFIPSSNLVTGINFYQNKTFLCVPRWRSGVPSTLNTLEFNPVTGAPLLKPFPNWEWQRNVLHYVQAVYVDRIRGNIWIIDTGRENFYNNNTATIQNRAAGLIVMHIDSGEVLHNISFPDAIFPFNSSFLNDIRVDPTGTRAYMTDTNLDGLGAVVVLDVTTGFVRRVSNPTMLIQPGYVVDVGGVMYPNVRAPSDGIGLAPDGSALYYSVITGSHLFRVPTDMLFDTAVTDDAILAATTVLFNKSTSSDGMDVVDVTNPSDASGTQTWAAIYGDFVHDGLTMLSFDARESVVAGLSGQDSARTLTQSNSRMEWIDTIVADKNPNDSGSIVAYFTSNRLPQYVTWSMDFSGGDGSNMRVWKMVVPRASYSNSHSPTTIAPTWTVAVMATLSALLAAIIALYWVVRRAKVQRADTLPLVA